MVDKNAYGQQITIFFDQELGELLGGILATAVVALGLKIIVDVVVAADVYCEQGVANILGDFF